MKRLITILAVLTIVCAMTLPADAAVRVRGYFRSNGTYVRPHYRSNPDGNFRNNWGTYPNINPYTGVRGTRRTPSYSRSYPSLMPRYNWSTPSYSNSHSWSLPSYSTPSYSFPSYGTLGSSPWGR
ncbi:MAG: hypothetical protein ISS70_08195 [Phycisphaerae bacterium]|nr:hypothetical protein [Phycisphaerae bacterium]